MFAWILQIQRKLRASRPFPMAWLAILEKQVPFYQDYDENLKSKFRKYLKLFIWEKYFIGIQEMKITDEVKVVIGACAIRLVIHLDLNHYNRLTEIIVYPQHFKHDETDGTVLGEANKRGSVVFSWPAVLHGLRNSHDGLDTAIHEFAHVLDAGDGFFDGTPQLLSLSNYSPWASVLSQHFLKLRAGKSKEKKVLRNYGALNEAEFFAVATEAYFEKTEQMKKHTPDLFDELNAFYGDLAN